MFAGFLEADKVCQGRFKVSGTTATLAVVVGWEVFVANVGDSEAYLDTGKQVGWLPDTWLQLSYTGLRQPQAWLRRCFLAAAAAAAAAAASALHRRAPVGATSCRSFAFIVLCR
jgi:hypothetical protein